MIYCHSYRTTKRYLSEKLWPLGGWTSDLRVGQDSTTTPAPCKPKQIKIQHVEVCKLRVLVKDPRPLPRAYGPSRVLHILYWLYMWSSLPV